MDRDRTNRPDATTQVPATEREAATDAPTNVETKGGTAPTSAGTERQWTAPARYRIEAVIGRGGMGEVVSARDEQIGRSVAIKRIRADDASPDEVARFLREARIQGRLEHPAVVPVHELWRDGRGQPFFVMKQLAGTTLADVVAKLAAGDAPATGTFSRQRLLRAFAEVCLAIEFAHTRGVVHRDLKPSNIMLGDFGEVYVLDWGIARVIGDEANKRSFADIETLEVGATQTGALLGTPGYMSPEQIRGDGDLDGRADVYALGCILFELLAFEPLHAHGTAAIAGALVGVDARPSVRAPDRDIPPELDAVCVAATAAERGARIATPRALGDAVQRYLDGDRDLAMRQNLARAELDFARTALAAGNGVEHRRAAIRAAARALALDPHAREAAELVGRLMIEPPAEVPREVEVELESMDLDALRSAERPVALSQLAYLAFFPIMYLQGFREAWFHVSGLVLVCANLVLLYVAKGIPMFYRIGLVANALLIAVFARVLSPFLVAPGLAIITAMVISSHLRTGRSWFLVAALVGGVLGPLLAEVAGAISPTTVVVSDGLVLHLSATGLDPAVTLTALALYVVVVVALTVVLSRSLVRNRRDMQRALQVQSWQLRQLVHAGA